MSSAAGPADGEIAEASPGRGLTIFRWIALACLLAGSAMLVLPTILSRASRVQTLYPIGLIAVLTGLGALPWSGGFQRQPFLAILCGLVGIVVGVAIAATKVYEEFSWVIGVLVALPGFMAVAGAIARLAQRK